jgi:hypothetical protein
VPFPSIALDPDAAPVGLHDLLADVEAEPFESMDSAWAWVERFVDWYKSEGYTEADLAVEPGPVHRGGHSQP